MDIHPLDSRVDHTLKVIFYRKFHESHKEMFIYHLNDYVTQEMEFVEAGVRNAVDKGEKYINEFIKENSEYIELKDQKNNVPPHLKRCGLIGTCF